MKVPSASLACPGWVVRAASIPLIGHIVSRNVPNSVGSCAWAKRPGLCGHADVAVVSIVGVAALFFGNVNQVLVRLWARVTQDLSVVCG